MSSYEPNPLNRFASYSYRIKIFMYQSPVISYANYQNGKLIIDTASTAQYNIQSMEQVHYMGFSNARHAFANSFTIQIAESNGVTLYQTIAAAAGELGVQNAIVNAKYAIEISFPGLEPGNKPGLEGPFVIPVTFLKIDANITERGTLYTIDAVEIGSNTFNYTLGTIKRTVAFEADTVGKAIEEFQKRVNEQEVAEFETNVNALSYNEYKFELDGEAQEWADWKIKADEINPGTDNIGDQTQFQIVAGTNIHEFFSKILVTTDEYKAYPVVTGSYASPDPDSPPNNFDLKLLFKIIGNETDIEYDPVSGRYSKIITYKIKKHISPDMIVSAEEVSNFQSNPGLQNTRVQHILGLGLLKRRYDYLYTGKNTEVINLDIKLETTYFLVSPQSAGQVFTDRLIGDEIPSPEKIEQKQSPDSAASARNSVITARQLANAPNADPNAIKSAISARDAARSDIIKNIPQSGTLRYVYNSDAVSKENYRAPRSDATSPAVLRFGASLENLFSNKDLMNIELQIRGDPYWLGNPNSLNGLSVPITAADYESGANYFYLKINLPVADGPSNDFVISGLYRVTSVISEYRNGKFIQYLKAFRDAIVSTDIVISTLESGVGSAPITGPNLPLDSAKVSQNAGGSRVTGGGGGGQGDNNPDISSPKKEGDSLPEGTTRPPPEPSYVDGGAKPGADPTNTTVAAAATDTNAIILDNVNLIGVYGTPANRSALMRLPSGETKTVKIGQSIDGVGTVTGMSGSSITFDNNGSTDTYSMPDD